MSKSDVAFAKVRSQFDVYTRDHALCFATHPVGASLTVQSEAKDCDINYIMERYTKTGLLEHVNKHQLDYADVTPIPDFHTAQNMVAKARESFMELPAKMRSQFGNDPGAFLEFANDPKNHAQLIEMGLGTDEQVAAYRALQAESMEPGGGEAPRAREGRSEGSGKAPKGRAGPKDEDEA